MAYDKPHKREIQNARRDKQANRKVFGFSASASRDDDEDVKTSKRYY